MRTRVQVYQPEPGTNQPGVPQEIANARAIPLRAAIDLMRLHGIGRLTLKYSLVGITSLVDVSFRPLPDAPPEPLLRARNFLVRRIADILQVFSIMDIEILPTEEEMVEIRKGWAQLRKLKPKGPEGAAAHETIQLNIEDDPTGESVLPEADNGRGEKEETGTDSPGEPERPASEEAEPETGGEEGQTPVT